MPYTKSPKNPKKLTKLFKIHKKLKKNTLSHHMKLLLFLGIALIIDVGIGLQGYRKYLQHRHSEFYLPNDILLELFVGVRIFWVFWGWKIRAKNFATKRNRSAIAGPALKLHCEFLVFLQRLTARFLSQLSRNSRFYAQAWFFLAKKNFFLSKKNFFHI